MAKDWKAEYDLAERENANLRAILRWCDSKLSDADHNELVALMDKPIEAGGVVSDSADDAEEKAADLAKLLGQIAGHFDPIVGASPEDIDRAMGLAWHMRAEALLSQAREHEPKRPLMRRVDGKPNVFAPVRKGEI